MSEVSGKFKGRLAFLDLSKLEAPKPWMKVKFEITHQFNDSVKEFEELDQKGQFAEKTYWLMKEKSSPDKKMTPHEFSTKNFKDAFGIEMFKYDDVDDLHTELKGVEKVLILEAKTDTEYNRDHHLIQYINNLGGGQTSREGRSSLASLR